jgi:CsoR family transcriptional regulator, copper-sensing transcriptional repressor
MAERGYTATKEQLSKRLARIEGQVRGVSRMVDEGRYCIDVLTQISAVQAALDKVALGLLDDHTRHCVVGHGASVEQTEEVMSAVNGLMRRGTAGESDLTAIEANVRAVATMISADTYCIDVLAAISSIQAGLDGVALGLLDNHARVCLLGDGDGRDQAGELMSAVGRLMRRG